MNKPLKMLIAVAVLAFTAAGMYYALFAPSKTATPPKVAGKDGPTAPRQPVPVPGARVGSELPGTIASGSASANAMPSPAASPEPATTAGASVPGFSRADEPMKPLPANLGGFEPVSTSGQPVPSTGTVLVRQGSQAIAAPASAASGATGATTIAPATAPAATPAAVTVVTPPASPQQPATPPASAPTAPRTTTVSAPAAPAAVAAPAAPAKAQTYTVKEGDSLAGIWRDLTGSERGWEALQAANPGLDPSRLKIGQVLKVPDSRPAEPGRATTTAATPATTAVTPGTYTIQSGDTLSSIAQKVYGQSKLWNRIYEANKDAIGSDPAALKVGAVLRIPPKAGETPAPAKPAAPTAAPALPPGTIGAPASAPAPSNVSTPAPR